MIYRMAYRYTGNKSDAEDIAQDICLKLVHKLGSFKGNGRFSTWLYSLVMNRCRDSDKSRRSHRALEQNYTEIEKHEQENQKDSNRKIAWLYRHISQLEPALKETALLVLTEELSHGEAARILGCAESTISWRMLKIREYLKERLV